MAYGAGSVAASAAAAAELMHPRPYAAPEIAAVFQRYPHIGRVLPAVGYSAAQLEALRQTINQTPADVVVSATPLDLASRLQLNKPVIRARYDFAEMDKPGLGMLLHEFLASGRKAS